MLARWTTTAAAVAFAFTATATAGGQKADVKKPLGTWTRTCDDVQVTFDIKPDGMRILLKNAADNSITVVADYGVSQDGVLFGRMSKVEKKGIEGGPSEGDLFSFR